MNGVLGDMVVEGLFQGQGGTAAPTFFDLGVGLTINGFSILGGNTAQNSLINANIRAGEASAESTSRMERSTARFSRIRRRRGE